MKRTLLKIYYKTLKIKDAILVLYNAFIAKIVAPPKVKSTDDTLNKIVEEKVSVSRFGDGEFGLMTGKNLIFQPYNAELGLRLKEIIKSHQDNHIVCIPDVFDNLDWCTEQATNYWTKYLNLNRSKVYRMINKKKDYYDTQVTRLYIDHHDKSKAEARFETFKKLWNKREVIIVEGEKSRLGVGNNLFTNVKSIKRIICPSNNAFSKYKEILTEVKKQDKNKLIVIALGPTATVLSYDLSKYGYQAIDIGHIDIEYEWFLQKAIEKGPVKNKYIGEVVNGTFVGDIDDINYQRSILTIIN